MVFAMPEAVIPVVHTNIMGLLLSFSHCAKEAESNPSLYFKLKTEILPKQGGSILLDEGDYLANSIRTVYARPNEGWIFDHWEGSLSLPKSFWIKYLRWVNLKMC